ncbi:MAG: hypothetical protein AAGA19_15480 [Pseudomonadota bacterium]
MAEQMDPAAQEPGTSRPTRRGRLRRFAVLSLALSFFLQPTGALAEEATRSLRVELNALQPSDSGCRITLVAENGLGHAAETIVLETVLFTKSGEVERLTLFDLGDMPVGRPRVRQFDIAGLECGNLGRVLINGLSACEGPGLTPDLCLDAMTLRSRLDVELVG